MSRSLSYIFPPGNTTDVCQVQTLGGAADLILNGNLANPVTNQVSFISQGYSRSFSITSSNNLSGVVFTVTGIQNGIEFMEEINGPNDDTVYGTNIFDVITSISTDNAAADVSIGSGPLGVFRVISVDINKETINYLLTVARSTLTSIPITVYGSLVGINQLGLYADAFNNPLLYLIDTITPQDIYVLTGADPWVSLLVRLDGEDVTINNGMQLNFVQT